MKAVSAAARVIDPVCEVREARAAFEACLKGPFAEDPEIRFGAKAEYAIFAYAAGDRPTAEKLGAELDKLSARWNADTRELNAPLARRFAAARTLAARSDSLST